MRMREIVHMHGGGGGESKEELKREILHQWRCMVCSALKEVV